MRIHRNIATLLLFVVVVTAGARAARATLLSDLLAPGQSIQVGGLLFDNFSYLQTGNMPAADAINVDAYAPLAGEFGLLFQGSFLDFFGGSGSNALISYRVSSITPGVSILGASLAGVPTVLGGDGILSVTASFLPQNGSDVLSIYSASPGLTQTTASVGFASPYTSLNVQNSVSAFAVTGLPGISFFTPTFHTSVIPIPEPASLTLLGIALATLAWRRARRK